jgi:hypothetical protein
MQPTQPCRIYLHPTAASCPEKIKAVIARTGLAIVIGGNSRAAALKPQSVPTAQGDFAPWDGAA